MFNTERGVIVSKFAVAVLVTMLLAGTVLAIHDFQVYDYNIDSYTGQVGRDRRAYDPYTRERYFGSDYDRQLVNYGMKGPTNRVINTGAKSAFSSAFNFDTNTFSNRGRDPSYISNFDPDVRGFNRLDRYVDLLPYSPVEQEFNFDETLAKGTVRILSTGNQYGAGLNKAYPRSQIFLQARNLPPIGDGEIYEAWLLDAETEYALSLGLIKSGQGLTSQLVWEIRRLVHMFDYVMITKEPYPDLDPSPGEVVLFGDINKPRINEDPAASAFDRLR
jgi:hypothetical protein